MVLNLPGVLTVVPDCTFPATLGQVMSWPFFKFANNYGISCQIPGLQNIIYVLKFESSSFTQNSATAMLRNDSEAMWFGVAGINVFK